MTNNVAIESAKVEFNENGTPISDKFDDIYFSNQDGLEECFYVFVGQNGLEQRFPILAASASRFCIGETGFGTGLNLMAAWSCFNQFCKDSSAVLAFYSFEKYPLTRDDLQKALTNWPQVKDIADELIASYPEKISGDVTLYLQQGQIELHLIIGDVNDRISQISKTDFAINAWFLDGFAPSKNPDMWTQNLFDNMARLSSEQATLATFTAAGFVRRGLQAAGFNMKKAKGFGTKREMILGQLEYTEL